jgi:hypothetical protein
MTKKDKNIIDMSEYQMPKPGDVFEFDVDVSKEQQQELEDMIQQLAEMSEATFLSTNEFDAFIKDREQKFKEFETCIEIIHTAIHWDFDTHTECENEELKALADQAKAKLDDLIINHGV